MEIVSFAQKVCDKLPWKLYARKLIVKISAKVMMSASVSVQQGCYMTGIKSKIIAANWIYLWQVLFEMKDDPGKVQIEFLDGA
jgi:hypothetical protein